jgi:hypothetical protein
VSWLLANVILSLFAYYSYPYDFSESANYLTMTLSFSFFMVFLPALLIGYVVNKNIGIKFGYLVVTSFFLLLWPSLWISDQPTLLITGLWLAALVGCANFWLIANLKLNK